MELVELKLHSKLHLIHNRVNYSNRYHKSNLQLWSQKWLLRSLQSYHKLRLLMVRWKPKILLQVSEIRAVIFFKTIISLSQWTIRSISLPLKKSVPLWSLGETKKYLLNKLWMRATSRYRACPLFLILIKWCSKKTQWHSRLSLIRSRLSNIFDTIKYKRS